MPAILCHRASESPAVQVVNAMDAMGNAVFSDGVSLVFTLTITNLANSKAGLAVASVRELPNSSNAVPAQQWLLLPGLLDVL